MGSDTIADAIGAVYVGDEGTVVGRQGTRCSHIVATARWCARAGR
jgi:hypothetical protein